MHVRSKPGNHPHAMRLRESLKPSATCGQECMEGDTADWRSLTTFAWVSGARSCGLTRHRRAKGDSPTDQEEYSSLMHEIDVFYPTGISTRIYAFSMNLSENSRRSCTEKYRSDLIKLLLTVTPQNLRLRFNRHER